MIGSTNDNNTHLVKTIITKYFEYAKLMGKLCCFTKMKQIIAINTKFFFYMWS